jgi:hypothetical protein
MVSFLTVRVPDPDLVGFWASRTGSVIFVRIRIITLKSKKPVHKVEDLQYRTACCTSITELTA